MSYYCSDTHCDARISVSLDTDNTYLNNSIITCKNIIIIKKHSLSYSNHNYVRKKEIKFDIENLGKISLIKKCKEYKYLVNFIKEIAIKNPDLCYKNNALEDYINSNYNGIKLDYNTIDKEIITIKKNLYLKKHKKINNENVDEIEIKNIINISNICKSISSNIKKYFSRNRNIHNLLSNINYKEYNISDFTEVKFKRRNKEYKKIIYFYITEEMKKTLGNSNLINQWFMDCTYYAIPRNNNSYKLLLIIAFNKNKKQTYLGAIILLQNENVETFSSIFNYLESKYNFNPKCINIDCSSSEIIAIKKKYPHCKIILCYYHIVKRIIKHLPQLKNKNESIKNKAKDLFSNVKLLLFLNVNKLKEFFQLIINKYEKDFPKFIKYFYTNFFKRYPLNDLCWNYDLNFIFEENSIDDFFLTNNICESTNRLLNMNYKGVCKSVKNFEDAIIALINLYNDKNTYIEGKFSVTRAIALFIRTENINSLIIYNTFKTIFKNYANYLKDRNISYEENEICDNVLEVQLEKNININKELNYSSNFESSSSVDSDEEVIYNFCPFEDNKDDSEGDKDKDNSENSNNVELNNKNKMVKKGRSKSRNNKKSSSRKNKKNTLYYSIYKGKSKDYLEDDYYFTYCKFMKKNILNSGFNFKNPLILCDISKDCKISNIFEINYSTTEKKFIKLNDGLDNTLHDERTNYKLNLRKIKLNNYINNIRFGLENLSLCSDL